MGHQIYWKHHLYRGITLNLSCPYGKVLCQLRQGNINFPLREVLNCSMVPMPALSRHSPSPSPHARHLVEESHLFIILYAPFHSHISDHRRAYWYSNNGRRREYPKYFEEIEGHRILGFQSILNSLSYNEIRSKQC